MAWLSERSRNGGVDEVPLDGLLGRLFLAGKHFIGPDPEVAVARVGADLVVCLNERHELENRYPDYVAWLRHHLGTRALWHPIPDLHAPAFTEAVSLLTGLHDRLARGEVLLVHCGAGVGRAGTVAAGLLVLNGADVESATAVVASARPSAGPEAGAQEDLLRMLAADRLG